MLRLQTALPDALHLGRRPTSWPAGSVPPRRRSGPRVVHPRAPLPAGRGHGLGRRPGRLLRAVPDRRRPDRGRVRRVLRRPLHGRVGRHPDRRPPAGAAPRPQRRVLDGRHGRHRLGRGGLGDPGRRHRHRAGRAGHVHELLGRPQGLRGPQRRRGLHLVQRPGRARPGRSARTADGTDAGATRSCSSPTSTWAATPASSSATARTTWPCGTPGSTSGGLDDAAAQVGRPAAVEGPLLGPPALPPGPRRGLPGRAPRRHRGRPSRVRP